MGYMYNSPNFIDRYSAAQNNKYLTDPNEMDINEFLSNELPSDTVIKELEKACDEILYNKHQPKVPVSTVDNVRS